MNAFDALSCTQWIQEIKKPVLGINHGMHLLMEGHDEDQHHYLGVIPGRVQSFHQHECNASNMGWHTLQTVQEHPLLHGIGQDQRFYFVHQDFLPPLDHAIATSTCDNTFTAVVAKDHYMGVQFSPEKSGRAGSMLLQNFLTIVEKQ
jgi:glutamine amidotransferase